MTPFNNRIKCEIKGIRKKKCKRRLIVQPTIRRYFYVCPDDISLVNTPYTIYANQFINDQGIPVQALRIFSLSGYTNLFVNGVMQGDSVFVINSQRLNLKATGQVIQAGTPIIIESISFRLVKKR